MIHLFIDTNIFLSFYQFSNDQVKRLEELATLIKTKKVKLYMTEQVIDEYMRNRESCFKKTVQHIGDFNTQYTVPVMCKDFKEMKSIQKLLENVAKHKRTILNRLQRQFKYNKLQIDKIMTEIIKISKPIDVTDQLYEKAVRRYNRGNPPGKNNSYGDAINWEILLEMVPRRQPLYFIGNDKDFVSSLSKKEFSTYLKNEWKKKKGSTVKLYTSVLEFVKKKKPDSKITNEEVEKEKTITNTSAKELVSEDRLVTSNPSFYDNVLANIAGLITPTNQKAFVNRLSYPVQSYLDLHEIMKSVRARKENDK